MRLRYSRFPQCERAGSGSRSIGTLDGVAKDLELDWIVENALHFLASSAKD